LINDKIYILKQNLDIVVVPGVADKTIEFYNHYTATANIKNISINAEHSWVTDNWRSNCTYLGFLYINNCGVDVAGDSLKHVFGEMNPRNLNINPKDNIVQFDQSHYTIVHPLLISMANIGYLYIPKSCYSNKCKLLIFFTGCGMDNIDDPDAFDERTGYNYWADTNNIVILFPQMRKTVLSPMVTIFFLL
jgi:hypothetical protein